jgi:hypothetical protein
MSFFYFDDQYDYFLLSFDNSVACVTKHTFFNLNLKSKFH